MEERGAGIERAHYGVEAAVIYLESFALNDFQ